MLIRIPDDDDDDGGGGDDDDDNAMSAYVSFDLACPIESM